MIYLPTIQGIIDRRILINYRLAPELLRGILPSPFRPKVVQGWAIAGFCLIRLKALRPNALPASLGLSSENAAHRIAVEWEENGQHREGVYIPIRHTSSHFNTLAGGKLFPGMHRHARFEVIEHDEMFHISVESDDNETQLTVEAQIAHDLPQTSIFGSLQEASTFFEQGSVGYSATKRPNTFDGLELRSRDWHIEPLQVARVESSFFDDQQRFPQGSIELDCALLMRHIDHEWHVQAPVHSC